MTLRGSGTVLREPRYDRPRQLGDRNGRWYFERKIKNAGAETALVNQLLPRILKILRVDFEKHRMIGGRFVTCLNIF